MNWLAEPSSNAGNKCLIFRSALLSVKKVGQEKIGGHKLRELSRYKRKVNLQ